MYSAAGGFVGTMYRGGSLGTNIIFTGSLLQPNGVVGITAAGTITAGAASSLTWAGRSRMFSPVDGNILLENAAQTSFNLLQFGGTTSSFPSLKTSGAALRVRLADDSADSALFVTHLITNGAAATASAGEIRYGATTATTVGAAGAAAAIPTPVGYIIINVAGTQMKIPYCNT